MRICSEPLQSEVTLLLRCQAIEGLSFSQLASQLQLIIPMDPIRRKGWVGQAIEQALGTTAGSQSAPDFLHLGIELKTIPVNQRGFAAESTFVTSIPLLTIHQQTWLTSQCFAKLRRVLWIPVEGEQSIPFSHRRIGSAILWSPSAEQEQILAYDWSELTEMIVTGQLEAINATLGKYLQVRPKAANARSLCYGFDEKGNKIMTLPRGFYLRSNFTTSILMRAG